MTKYDKELDTRTPEYEEATRPAPRDHSEDDAERDEPKGDDSPDEQK